MHHAMHPWPPLVHESSRRRLAHVSYASIYDLSLFFEQSMIYLCFPSRLVYIHQMLAMLVNLLLKTCRSTMHDNAYILKSDPIFMDENQRRSCLDVVEFASITCVVVD
jgi:hypothetical protein